MLGKTTPAELLQRISKAAPTLLAIVCFAVVLSWSCAAGAQSAHAAIWTVASHLWCKALKYRLCDRDSAVCQISPGQAGMEIDFGANMVSTGNHEFDEAIVVKTFAASRYSALPDTHLIVLSGGARVVNFDQPGRDEHGSVFVPAVFVDSDIRQVRTHFMRCSINVPMG